MAGLKLLSDNYVQYSDMTITTGTANSQFPVANLQNDSPSVKFRSTGNTVVIEFDLQQTRNIDTVALVGHPLDGLGITAATFKTSVTTDFSSSPVNTIDLSSEHNIGYKFITEVTHRFVELTLTGTGSYAELSNIYIGSRTEITTNSISVSTFRYRYDDLSEVKRNKYGQRFIDQRNLRKSISGTIEYCTTSEQETLDDLFLAHGRHTPIWVMIDTDNVAMTDSEYRLSMYAYFVEMPSWRATGGQTYSAPVRFEEAI